MRLSGLIPTVGLFANPKRNVFTVSARPKAAELAFERLKFVLDVLAPQIFLVLNLLSSPFRVTGWQSIVFAFSLVNCLGYLSEARLTVWRKSHWFESGWLSVVHS